MRVITLEEHHATPDFLRAAGFDPDGPLADVGAGRIAAMDEAGIDVQVLSVASPGVEPLDPAEAVAVAREENDRTAEAVRAHPDRFAAFATVPTPDPAAAADELERAVSELGFVGAFLNGHVRGRYLDDQAFWPVFERAEALGVPIYLHPTTPPQPVIDAYYSGFSPDVSMRLANFGWGWHIETSVHVLRLILGGVFDRFPSLQLVIGHLGEGLASMMQRIQAGLPVEATGLDRPVMAYLTENLHYTPSGFNYPAVFQCLLAQVGVDRIMFAADHPYQSMRAARDFLDALPVGPADREKIAHGNAERLFALPQ